MRLPIASVVISRKMPLGLIDRQQERIRVVPQRQVLQMAHVKGFNSDAQSYPENPKSKLLSATH